jgi:pimeloyl-ACP methyl ester carboxylesterase
VLAPDLWGHGESDPLPAQTQDLNELAQQHLTFLDALNIEQCHLVGLSVGGMWAARLAMQAPHRVDRLVLMATDLGAEADAPRIRYFQILDGLADTGHFEPAVLGVVISAFFHPNGRTIPAHRHAFKQRLLHLHPTIVRNSIAPLGRMIFGRSNALSRVSDLDSERTLIICGERDTPRPPAESRLMAELIGCRYLLVPDAGHIMNLEKPEFINDTLTAWLLPSAQKNQTVISANRLPGSTAPPT